MTIGLKKELEDRPIRVCAPCRIDCGGTFDIKTFSVLTHKDKPSTFNIALNIRTHVTLQPWKDNFVKVSSKGFEPEEFEHDNAPFNTPMGLVFAALHFFGFSGVHVNIVSDSPPKSALGGSSTMLVTVIWALNKVSERLNQRVLSREEVVSLAYQIEDGICSYTCGIQDHLASAFGGVNQWLWSDRTNNNLFSRRELLKREDKGDIDRAFIAAFCGITHDSGTINKKWITGFTSGIRREVWSEMAGEIKSFSDAVSKKDWDRAAFHIRRETTLRRELTPEVFTDTGQKLLKASDEAQCGARFTGAGGGGCVWAIGEHEKIALLKPIWGEILKEEGEILASDSDFKGLKEEIL